MLPRVSVVVVVHDGLPFTRLCIESILASTDAPPYELVVVDNGSADGTKEYLDSVGEAFAQVRVLRNDHNLGFPAGVNRGIGEARAQILALANNDVVVTPGWLSRLTRCLADPDIGLAGAVTNRIGNEAEIEASYRTYGELLAFADERARLNAEVVRDLGTATMFCLAMRREVWERLGPLDEEFGLGTLEDDDYSARARAAGLRIVCAEDAFVHHFGEASFGKLVSSWAVRPAIARESPSLRRKVGQGVAAVPPTAEQRLRRSAPSHPGAGRANRPGAVYRGGREPRRRATGLFRRKARLALSADRRGLLRRPLPGR